MGWRRWNNLLHRDVGYLITGMTVVYALSGIALNHMADWNPNYRRVEEVHDIGPMDREQPETELARTALARLKVDTPAKGSYQPDADTLQVFVEGASYTVDLPTGKVLYEAVRPRPVLYAMNRLHVNAPKRVWTWVADLYATALLVVSLTGLFILRGRNGLKGRGAWLTGLGCLVPLTYWLWWISR